MRVARAESGRESEEERDLLAGRRPRDSRDASAAERPAAYELMIFLSAYMSVIFRMTREGTYFIVEIVVSPSWDLLTLDGFTELSISLAYECRSLSIPSS